MRCAALGSKSSQQSSQVLFTCKNLFIQYLKTYSSENSFLTVNCVSSPRLHSSVALNIQ